MERLRKESSTLLAKERAYVNELLKQQANKKEQIGSFKLKVKWKENGVYDKDNIKSLFSKYGDVITIVVLEDKKCALVEYGCKTSAINAKNLEVGLINSPLLVTLIGDYGEETEKCFTQTSIPNSKNIFVGYQNKISDQTGNTTMTPPTTAQTFLDYEAMVLDRFRQAGKVANQE